MKNYNFYQSVLLVSFLVIIVLLRYNKDQLNYPTFMYDMFAGVASSCILLMVLEFREMANNKNHFIKGTYKRESFYNINKDAKVDTKYVQVPGYIGSEMQLIYKGQREYEIPAIQYEGGTAKATIILNETNRFEGNGTYQYTKFTGAALPVDIGHYTLHVDELDNKKLYVFHKNILPSGLAEGYEIWVKQS